jgi:multimeric flavodoxin WrbA
VIERAGFVSRANGNMFRRKPGAAVVAVRRAGAIHAFDTINHFFTIGEMITVGSIYWNIGLGREMGEAANDEERLKTMAALGQNMAWLLKKIGGGGN